MGESMAIQSTPLNRDGENILTNLVALEEDDLMSGDVTVAVGNSTMLSVLALEHGDTLANLLA